MLPQSCGDNMTYVDLFNRATLTINPTMESELVRKTLIFNSPNFAKVYIRRGRQIGISNDVFGQKTPERISEEDALGF